MTGASDSTYSAASASDFVGGVLPTGTISFANGETSKTLTINVAGDTAVETSERFNVTLSSASNATLGTSSDYGAINNDDVAAPAVISIASTIADTVKNEGNSGSTPFTFTINRSNGIGASSVNYTVIGASDSTRSAASANDFFGGSLPSGTISFANGETSKSLTINIAGDTTVESVELFKVSLSTPSNATLGNSSEIGVINNDDGGGGTTDNTAPILTNLSPADEAGNVAVGANIVLTFNEAVHTGTGIIHLDNFTKGGGRDISVSDTTQVSFSGNTMTINPVDDLTNGNHIEVTFSAGAVFDSAGNSFAGLAAGVLDFTTTGVTLGTTQLNTLSALTTAKAGTESFQDSISSNSVTSIHVQNIGADAGQHVQCVVYVQDARYGNIPGSWGCPKTVFNTVGTYGGTYKDFHVGVIPIVGSAFLSPNGTYGHTGIITAVDTVRTVNTDGSIHDQYKITYRAANENGRTVEQGGEAPPKDVIVYKDFLSLDWKYLYGTEADYTHDVGAINSEITAMLHNGLLVGETDTNSINQLINRFFLANTADKHDSLINLVGLLDSEHGSPVSVSDLVNSDLLKDVLAGAKVGANGDDFLSGDANRNVLMGGAGEDKIDAQGGDDVLRGGLGSDILNGGTGNDTIDGGLGFDTASYKNIAGSLTVDLNIVNRSQNTGAAGNDTLISIENVYGSDYNDTLIGNSDHNVLTGALGKDILTGGLGSDTFDFNSIAETGNTAATADTIADFKSSEGDKIDLSGIDANLTMAGDQAFTFIGTAAFSSTDATGQLRFDATNHILYGSTGNDNVADFAIRLTGVNTLSVSDFYL